MICPKCQKERMKVTHSYSVPGGSTQRLECPRCLTVATVEAVVIAIDPRYGEGAAARAARLKRLADQEAL